MIDLIIVGEAKQLMVAEETKAEADNLVRDLIAILAKHESDHVELIQDLCIYIVARDLKLQIHAYNLGGKDSNAKRQTA
jgi:hypothetical protein